MTLPQDRIRNAGRIADAILKIAAAISLVSGGIAFALFNEVTRATVRDFLGITELRDRVVVLEKRMPGNTVAEYDPVYSEIVGPCHIGAICTARFRIRRTPYGSGCGLPLVTPYIRNHGAIRHPAEYIGGAIRASDEHWDFVDIQFRAPSTALPGRGVYYSEQGYDCPFGREDELSDKIPFILLPAKE